MDAKTEIDAIIPPDEVNRGILSDRAARRSGEIGSLSNPSDIGREVIAAVARHVRPEKIGQVLERLMDAKRYLRDGTELDDTRAQEAGAKLYLAYMIGTPIQRVETVNVNLDADSAVGLEERLRHSPAMRAMMRKMLDKADSASDVTVSADLPSAV
jgi:hypothetical protein